MSDFTCKKLNRPARISGLKQNLTEAYTEAPEEEFLNSLKGKSQEELYAFISYALPRLPKGAGSGAFSSFTNYYSSKDASGQQFFTSKDVEGALEELRQADEETLRKVAEYALMHWCDGSDAQKIIHGYEAEGKQMGEAEGDEDAPADDSETPPADDAEPPADEGGEDDLPDVSDEPAPEDTEGDTPPAEDAAPADDAADAEDGGDEDIDSIIAGLDDEDGDGEGDEGGDEPADAEGGEEGAEDGGDAPEDAEGDAGEDDAADEPVDAFDGETVAKFVAKHLNIEDPDEILDVIESAL